MPNIKSAEKRVRQTEKRYVLNRTMRASARTAVKKARAAIDSGAENAPELVRLAERALDKAATKGVIHENNAARRKGRLKSALVKSNTVENA